MWLYKTLFVWLIFEKIHASSDINNPSFEGGCEILQTTPCRQSGRRQITAGKRQQYPAGD
jgi:hypothetical protein